MEDEVNGGSMVLDVEPIAHVQTFPIYGQRLVMPYVVDEQRD